MKQAAQTINKIYGQPKNPSKDLYSPKYAKEIEEEEEARIRAEEEDEDFAPPEEGDIKDGEEGEEPEEPYDEEIEQVEELIRSMRVQTSKKIEDAYWGVLLRLLDAIPAKIARDAAYKDIVLSYFH